MNILLLRGGRRCARPMAGHPNNWDKKVKTLSASSNIVARKFFAEYRVYKQIIDGNTMHNAYKCLIF